MLRSVGKQSGEYVESLTQVKSGLEVLMSFPFYHNITRTLVTANPRIEDG